MCLTKSKQNFETVETLPAGGVSVTIQKLFLSLPVGGDILIKRPTFFKY